MTLRVLVVEDEWPARNSLVELIQQTKVADVVAAVATLAEARQALAPQAGAGIHVSVVDVPLPPRPQGRSGIPRGREGAHAPDAPPFVLPPADKQHAPQAYDTPAPG